MEGNLRPEARLMNLQLPWALPVGQREIAPEVHSVIIVLSPDSSPCTYSPNSSRQCLYKYIVCPVEISCRLRVPDTPSEAGNAWSQKIAAHTRTTVMTAGIIFNGGAEYEPLHHSLTVRINRSASGTSLFLSQKFKRML